MCYTVFMKLRNTQQLTDAANRLYELEADITTWLKTFQPLELAKLWYETCQFTKANPFGAGYDDEVYEALRIIGYWDN